MTPATLTITEAPAIAQDLGAQLALAVKTLEDVEQEKADRLAKLAEEKSELVADFNKRILNLRGDIKRLALDILTGQKELFAEESEDQKSKGAGA